MVLIYFLLTLKQLCACYFIWKRHLWTQHLSRLVSNFFRWWRHFLNVFLANTENPSLWEASTFFLFVLNERAESGTKCPRMDLVKFLEDSLLKVWSDMVLLSRPYHFKFFKGCLLPISPGPFLNTLSHILLESRRD